MLLLGFKGQVNTCQQEWLKYTSVSTKYSDMKKIKTMLDSYTLISAFILALLRHDFP